jgi:hypothetical protein
MRRITPALLALAGAVAAGCGGGAAADEVIHTYDDGSTATVASATDSELRSAGIAMETIYTKTGTYNGGDLLVELESLGDGRLYPQIDLRVAEADTDTFCVEGGKDDYVKHVRRGEFAPREGGC